MLKTLTLLLATFLLTTSALAQSASQTTCTKEEQFPACARWAKDEPTNPLAYLWLGHTAKDPNTKLAYYARAIELGKMDKKNSVDLVALFFMGKIHTELKDYDAAIADYDRCAQVANHTKDGNPSVPY